MMSEDVGKEMVNNSSRMTVKKTLFLIVLLLILGVAASIYIEEKSVRVEYHIPEIELDDDVQDKQTFYNDKIGLKFSVPEHFTPDLTSAKKNDVFPTIYFGSDMGNVGDDCYFDCMQTTAFLRQIVDSHNRGIHWIDIDLKEELDTAPFLRDGGKYYYKDSDKKVGVGNYHASRFVAAGKMDTDDKGRSSGKYIIAEKVYIRDPYIQNRVLVLDYQQTLDELPIEEKETGVEEIKLLFDKVQYEIFNHVLDSLEFLSPSVEMITGEFDELGLSINYPEYWGSLINKESYIEMLGKGDTYSVHFESPAFGPYTDVSRIYFQIHSEESANWAYEALGNYLAQYSGQPLREYCENQGFLGKNSRSILVSECDVLNLENGVQVGVIRGSYAITGGYGPDIPEYAWNHRRFKIASVKTNSDKWSGFNIVLEDTGSSFVDSLDEFDAIVESISYIDK